MKNIKITLIAASLLGLFSGCVASSTPSIESATKLDEKVVCSVQASGINSVIETAEVYNEIAKANKLEFRRLDVNNTDLINSVKEAIKTGAKEVNPVTFKGKPSKTKLPTEYAAERACKFAIAALVQSVDAKKTWRLSVPGDGYKY